MTSSVKNEEPIWRRTLYGILYLILAFVRLLLRWLRRRRLASREKTA